MSMIAQKDKFRFSSSKYALQLDRAESYSRQWWHRQWKRDMFSYILEVPAIWFRRRDGELTVYEGNIEGFLQSYEPIKISTQEMLGITFSEDTSVQVSSGHPEYRWDKRNGLWRRNHDLSDSLEVKAKLDSYLDSFPEIPQGFSGWYALREF